MTARGQSLHILGQGLAGTCVAWELLERDVRFSIEDDDRGGSSRVAAGLINPITGKNFEPSWKIAEFHPLAMEFYQSLEKRFGENFWHPLPVLRLASTEKEWAKISSKLSLSQTAPWIGSNTCPTPSGFLGSVELTGGGWVDTAKFLRFSRDHFESFGIFRETGQRSPSEDLCRVRCEGAAGLMDGGLGEHRCAKGEILTVEADWPETHIRIGAGGWMVPIGGGRFRVGSTYEWNRLDQSPTEAGLERITAIATKLAGPDFRIISHDAGIRPILRRSQPLLGKNVEGDWVFNGLGSKGTLYAPGMATKLADWICEGIPPESDLMLTPVNTDN